MGIVNDSALGVDMAVGESARVNVLVEIEGTPGVLTAIGFRLRTQVQGILSGDIPIDSIPALEQVPHCGAHAGGDASSHCGGYQALSRNDGTSGRTNRRDAKQ
jgi:hypothetical protein